MTPAKSNQNASAPRAERLGVLLSVLTAVIWLGQAAIIAAVLGGLLTAPQTVAVLPAMAGFLTLAILRIAVDLLSQRALAQAVDSRIAALRAEILSVETTAASPAPDHGPGALAALASDKLEALRPWLLRFRPARMRSSVLPLVILAIAAWHSWAVALVLLIAGPLIPVFMALVGWAAKTASERQMVEIGGLSDLLVDRLAALADLRLIGAGDAVVAGFAAASDRLRARTMSVLRIAFLSSTVLELFSALGVAMVAIWVGFSALGALGWGGWGHELTPQAGIFLLLLTPEFFQPLRDLAAAWHDRAAAEAVLDEIAAWRGADRVPRMGTGATGTAPAAPLNLRLDGVEAGGIVYPDLALGPGETLAITGPSGSGKTTLLRLIAGLQRPDRGSIFADGAALDDASADVWRAGLGWMPQAPHFLNRSLRHNIGFGAPPDPATTRAAHLDQVLARLPKGDLTLLGERGAGLSGGESRRVTLARAFHGAPRLILADEPTADLDAGTAAGIAEALTGFARRGGSVIIATHDPVLAARMDRQICLSHEPEGTA